MRPFQASQQDLDRPTRNAKRTRFWGLALLAAAVVAGVVLERVGILDWRTGVAYAQGYTGRWWLAPALALTTAGLFATSLPGSLMVWVVGILLPPEVAVAAFVLGGTAGSLVAQTLGRIAGGRSGRDPEEDRLLGLLARRSDLATLLAVRIAPGFPHSAINVAAGVLGVPRLRFLVSTALGFAVKGTLYATAIHQATRVAAPDGAISWRTIAPLVGLSILLLLGPPAVRRLRGPREPVAAPIEPV